MARVGSPALCQGGACGHGELPPQPPLPGHPQVEEPNPALLAAPRPWAAPTRGDQRRAPRAPLSAPSRRSCSPAGPRGAPRAQHTSSPTCCLILARAADGSGKMTARSRSRGEGFCSELPALLQAFGAFSWHLLGGALRRLRARVGTPGKESKDVGEACPGFQIPLRRNSCRWLSTASQQGTNRRTEITRAKWRQSPCKGPAGAALAPPPPAREAGGSWERSPLRGFCTTQPRGLQGSSLPESFQLPQPVQGWRHGSLQLQAPPGQVERGEHDRSCSRTARTGTRQQPLL